MQLTRDNVLWFAGLFEGEGCFLLNDGRKSLGLAIQMNDLDVLEKVRDRFGGWIWSGRKMRSPKHRQAHVWKITKRDEAYALVAAMYPDLGARRQARARDWLAKYVGLSATRRTISHGKASTYTARRCRCGDCRTAFNAYRRKLYAEGRLQRIQPTQ